MKKYTTFITTEKGEQKEISVWLDDETARAIDEANDPEITQFYILDKHKEDLIDLKETRRHKLLWRISRSKVKAKKIRFNAIRVYGTASIQYILVKVASDLYRDTAYSSYKELCDKYLISDRYFELIITAMHIRRYGYDYLPIKRTFN